MTENFGQDTEPVAEIDELDVEGHGLREVAIGLSAATAIAGGAGAAALALDNPLPGTTSGARAAVAGAQQDVQEHADWAVRTAGRCRRRRRRRADPTARPSRRRRASPASAGRSPTWRPHRPSCRPARCRRRSAAPASRPAPGRAGVPSRRGRSAAARPPEAPPRPRESAPRRPSRRAVRSPPVVRCARAGRRDDAGQARPARGCRRRRPAPARARRTGAAPGSGSAGCPPRARRCAPG